MALRAHRWCSVNVKLLAQGFRVGWPHLFICWHCGWKKRTDGAAPEYAPPGDWLPRWQRTRPDCVRKG